MNVSKDVYEYIMNFVNGNTLLKMTSINKKFNNDVYFERFMKRNYPKLKKETTYKNLYVKYRELIEFMDAKKFKIDDWFHPQESIFFNVTYRCTQYEKDVAFHNMQFADTCIGCQTCRYHVGDIAHSFLSYLIRIKKFSDLELEKYFHLQHVNLIAHRSKSGLCPTITPNACSQKQMFKVSEDIIKSLTIS